MPERYHFLTTPERDTVQDTINRVRHLIGGDSEFDVRFPPSAAQNIYMARLPDNQVLPAFNATTKKPGVAMCDVYKIGNDLTPSNAVVHKFIGQQIVWNIYRLPVLGVAADNEYYFQVSKDASGRWLCERPCSLVAKANADIAAGSAGDVTIQKGPRGSEMPTSTTLNVFNRTSLLWASGKFGGVDLVNGLVYGFPWECPPSEE